jgi:hypothetical protein
VRDAAANIADTDIGQLLAGTHPLLAFFKALVSAILALENVQKMLNYAQTVVESMMTAIVQIINGAFLEVVDLLEETRKVIGQILAPLIGVFVTALKIVTGALKLILVPLHILGGTFEWFYNYVIRPLGNTIIDAMNGVIGTINAITFVNIKNIERLDAIGELAVEDRNRWEV